MLSRKPRSHWPKKPREQSAFGGGGEGPPTRVKQPGLKSALLDSDRLVVGKPDPRQHANLRDDVERDKRRSHRLLIEDSVSRTSEPHAECAVK